MKTSKNYLLPVSILLAVAASAIFLDGVASRTVAEGCFHQVAHKGSGCAAIIRKPDGQIVLRLSDFETADSGDLQILLVSATDAFENETVKNSEKIHIGRISPSEGLQEFVVREGQNLTKFNSVVIWNSKHGVNFTTAPLRKY
ncbi:MAG: DM13 domain-containing protein [Pyrinomonadaceae bacterium]